MWILGATTIATRQKAGRLGIPAAGKSGGSGGGSVNVPAGMAFAVMLSASGNVNLASSEHGIGLPCLSLSASAVDGVIAHAAANIAAPTRKLCTAGPCIPRVLDIPSLLAVQSAGSRRARVL